MMTTKKALAGSVPPRRKAVLAAVGVAVVGVLVAVGLLVGGSGDEAPRDAASSSSGPVRTSAPTESPAAPAPTEEATPEPGAGSPVTDAGELPPALPEVPLDASGTAGDGVVVNLPRVDAITATGRGPGDVSGPALRVTVRVVNDTAEDISLGDVTVNLFYGAEATPASPIDDSSQQLFAGDLPAGEAAEAVYVFGVPSDMRDAVTVEVRHRADAPRLIFAGPVG